MNSYVIDYSESKNRSLLFKLLFYSGILFLIIVFGFIYLNPIIHQNNTVIIIIVFSFAFILLSIIAYLPNYLNNKKYMSQYHININDNKIGVINSEEETKLEFSFQEITKIIDISYGISTFCAIQLDIIDGKRVVVSSATNNYDLFLNDLAAKTNAHKKHKFKPTGSWIRNIY